MRPFHCWCTAMILFCGTTESIAADAQSYFRHAGGVYSTGTTLPIDLKKSENLVWRQPLESGHSTPCVIGQHIFVTTFSSETKELATVAMDRKTGKLLWRQVAPIEKLESVHPVGNPATASAASDGERVFVFFGSYGVLCYDFAGHLLWKKPMGPFQDEFGAGSSPILFENRLILNQDHDTNNYLVALDTHTGKELWKVTRNNFTRSYATPIIWKTRGQSQILVPGSTRLTAYAVETGKRIWWVDGLARIVNTIPAVSGEMLYVASWSPGGEIEGDRIAMEPWKEALATLDKNADGRLRRDELPNGSPVNSRFFRIDLDQNGALDQQEWEKHAEVFARSRNQVLAIRPSGEGNLTETHVLWKYARGIPYVASPLVHNNVLYMVKDGGILSSLDAGTGDVLRQARLRGRGNYYASPVAADGKLYVASERGVITIASATGKWKTLASHDFGEGIYATPVVDQGRLLVRTEKALYCYAKPASETPDNQLSDAERKAGWLLLFDGKSLTNWQTSDLKPSQTPVQEGAINPHQCGAYMMIHKQVWRDFQLQLDYKVSGKCNSGIFFRTFPLTPKPGRDVGYNGLEVAIDDAQQTGYHATGAIYDLVPVKQDLTRPTGQWNHLLLTCDKSRVSVELNGRLVSKLDLNEWTQAGTRPDGSDHKFRDIVFKDHPREGYIGLQDHGAPVWFKNIKLRPLNKSSE